MSLKHFRQLCAAHDNFVENGATDIPIFNKVEVPPLSSWASAGTARAAPLVSDIRKLIKSLKFAFDNPKSLICILSEGKTFSFIAFHINDCVLPLRKTAKSEKFPITF